MGVMCFGALTHGVNRHSVRQPLQLSGKRAVNVQSVLDHYDPSGDNTLLIGAKTFLLVKEHRTCVTPLPLHNAGSEDSFWDAQCRCSYRHAPTEALIPAASYDLQTAKLRESNTESSKFYVNSPGAGTCTVRTETPYAPSSVPWTALKLPFCDGGTRASSCNLDSS